MDIKKLVKPNVTEDKAIDLVQTIYGLEVTDVKKMISFNDQNFHVEVSNVHQNAYINQVSENGYTLKIINTMKSSLEGHFEMELNEKEKCGVHLLTYLPGIPLIKIAQSTNTYFQWGLLLAKFHNGMDDFVCPNLKTKRIFYSLENIPAMKNFTEGLGEKEMEMVNKVLGKYSREITENYEKIPKGFIHGDFNDYNILVQKKPGNEPQEEYFVDGILDFEDMHHGPYVWDIGLMLAHTLLNPNNMESFDAAGYTLAGYLSLRSLSELEMSLVKICIECRLCMTAVYCNHGIRSDPDNSYISELSQEVRWMRLEQLLKTQNTDLHQQWRLISQMDFK